MTPSKFKWQYLPHYWPFVRGIHRSPVNSSQTPVTRGFDCLWYAPKQTVEKTIEMPVIWDPTALIVTSLLWPWNHISVMASQITSNSLFRLITRKTSKLRNSGRSFRQRANNEESVSMSWRHHAMVLCWQESQVEWRFCFTVTYNAQERR